MKVVRLMIIMSKIISMMILLLEDILLFYFGVHWGEELKEQYCKDLSIVFCKVRNQMNPKYASRNQRDSFSFMSTISSELLSTLAIVIS